MTSPSRPAHPPRRRPTTLLSLSVLVAAALNGCSSDTDEPGNNRAAAHPAPKGVVTVDAARTTVDAYEKANNEANRTRGSRGARLLGTVEGGQVHEQSLADYEQFKTWSKKDQEEYGTEFVFTSRKYYIPDGQSWFAVRAKSSGSTSEALLVFDKVGGRLKMVASVYANEKTAIPEIAVRNGFATAVDPAKRVGPLAPNQLGDAFEDLVETGGKKQGRQLASTTATKEFAQRYVNRTKGKQAAFSKINYFDGKPVHPRVYALRLADGGVLAVFPTSYTIEFLHKRFMSGGRIIPGETEAIYNSERRPVVTDEYQGQALAALAPSRKPEVITWRYAMVDSR
ncbi:hypothetical protein [Streptomyces sp. IB201691-2A2]|uniref:hypothetical protein n=1 Tax=Streptomyces sp. IB201691-2A2 TaxID=2561920 RepID=UPI00117C3DB4|nr:hypothetical protein [Streptomyces sp. IB201691-2A2]TRO57055.1 hypothetical protein E4K73_43845 [Streptomyces sp. IB201691-2A2]